MKTESSDTGGRAARDARDAADPSRLEGDGAEALPEGKPAESFTAGPPAPVIVLFLLIPLLACLLFGYLDR